MTSIIVEALKTLQGVETSESQETASQLDSESTIDTEEEKDAAANAIVGDHVETPSGKDEALNNSMTENCSPSAPDNKEKNEPTPTGPLLSDPKVGNPISHGQIIELWGDLKSRNLSPPSLENLLKGVRGYVPPPPLKPEPTLEYKALMAKLRREEEARTYERMINPPPPTETFEQRFPTSSAANAFAANFPDVTSAEGDEVTYADIDRQIAVIFNVIVSIVACAAGLWMAARWWSTPARLALSMSGSLLVGVAEVVVYAGYIRRVGEAKGKAKNLQEVKEIVRTWVVGGRETLEEDASINITEKEQSADLKPRRRNI